MVDVLVVGAGQAGAQLAISLRQGGYTGSISLVGDEPDPPYERPPLSKDYLAGEKTAERLLLRPPHFWNERDIDLKLSTTIVRVDPDRRVAVTECGEELSYDHLVWAAGGYPRPLPVPGAKLEGVHVVRTRAQTDDLRRDLGWAQNVVIIGGGYIGLESAAVLVSQGKKVVLVEAMERILARVAGEPVSQFYAAEHRERGVDIRTGTGVTDFEGCGVRVSHVVTSDGERIPADVVIVGIGLIPSQAVLAQAGAATENGVIVDDHCRTSLPHIFAIGDCARHRSTFGGGDHIRLESVQNAVDQAKTVAGVLLGEPQPYNALPWFWSHQYDLKLQTAGLSHGHDEIVLRGDPGTRCFSLIYLRRGKVIAVDAINNVRDFMGAKLLVEAALEIDPALLADASVPLKEMHKRSREFE